MLLLSGRLLLFAVVLCFVMHGCETRGGGGGRGGGRGRGRGRFGGGSGNLTGMEVFAIIFGIIGGTLLLIGLCYFCIVCSSDSNDESAKDENAENAEVALNPRSTPTAPSNDYNASDDNTASHRRDDANRDIPPPPSYDSVVHGKGDNLPYSANPSEGHGYSTSGTGYGFSGGSNAHPPGAARGVAYSDPPAAGHWRANTPQSCSVQIV